MTRSCAEGTKNNPRARVLKKYPKARCWRRLVTKDSPQVWWQVWNAPKAGGQLIGMAKRRCDAWAEAEQNIKQKKYGIG